MPNKDSMVVAAFQTACLAIIVLNAKFVGDLFYKMSSEGCPSLRLSVFFILVSCLNFLEIVNNWASIKKYFSRYNSWLFLTDVITLGCFFWQIYVLSRWEEVLQNGSESARIALEQVEQKMILVAIVFYAVIFLLYVLWNCIILYTDSKRSDKLETYETKNIKKWGLKRGIQVGISIALIWYGVEKIPMCVLILGLLICIIFVSIHNHKLNIFDTIIKSKQQD